MKRRLPLVCAAAAAVTLIAAGLPVGGSGQDGIFVALREAQTGVHPARVFQLVRAEGIGKQSEITLEGSDGLLPLRVWRPSDDPETQLIRPTQPLKWDQAYRLCVTAERQGVARRLLPILRHCVGFRTMTLPLAQGAEDADILVLLGRDDAYGAFYPAILEAEGFPDVASVPVERFRPGGLAGRAVVILASGTVPDALALALEDWMRGGGLLVAMRPGADLLPMLGLSTSAGAFRGGQLVADARLPLTQRLAHGPIRLHGRIEPFTTRAPPDHRSDAGDAAILADPPPWLARLQDRHGTPLPYPAAAMNHVGQGMAAAFPFSLAETVAVTRQGNPQWAGQDRDGFHPLRANDLFYPDHLDMNALHVPQADELQRLLANVIVAGTSRPIPRFWYLPHQRRAVILLTGDDHATQGGTQRMFDLLESLDRPNCRLDRWDCLRASSYLDPETRFEAATSYAARGFEIGLHVDSGCRDRAPHDLAEIMDDQMAQFALRFPDLPPQQTTRLHCIVWSGWVDVPRIERAQGIRLDLNYYTWPPSWLAQRAGFMTGSGFPMPFVDEDGQPMPILQAATHLVNENGVPHAFGVASLLDRALGREQFFGAFGSHVDYTDDYAGAIIKAATDRGVALISARQMLDWLDARNGSTLSTGSWNGSALQMTLTLRQGAEQASVMLPAVFRDEALTSVRCNGQDMPITRIDIKGIVYGFFPATAGACRATYDRAEAALGNSPAPSVRDASSDRGGRP